MATATKSKPAEATPAAPASIQDYRQAPPLVELRQAYQVAEARLGERVAAARAEAAEAERADRELGRLQQNFLAGDATADATVEAHDNARSRRAAAVAALEALTVESGAVARHRDAYLAMNEDVRLRAERELGDVYRAAVQELAAALVAVSAANERAHQLFTALDQQFPGPFANTPDRWYFQRFALRTWSWDELRLPSGPDPNETKLGRWLRDAREAGMIE